MGKMKLDRKKLKNVSNSEQKLEKVSKDGKKNAFKKNKPQKKQRKKKNTLPKPEELLKQVLAEADLDTDRDPLQGFKVIKWKISSESDVIHHLFVKQHVPPIEELSDLKPHGRTLLCHNVPPFLNEGQVTNIFRHYGEVVRVFIHQKPSASVPRRPDHHFPAEKDIFKGFKVAYVVFSNAKYVNEILELDPNDVTPAVLPKRPRVGIQRWITSYNSKILPTSELEKVVKKFMEKYDQDEVKKKEMEKNGGVADDDGWVTVTRTGKGASGGLVRSEAMEERLKEKKRRQDKELMNITPAQVKETKMKQMVELRKKFEEDKQRIALMKQQRKFRPF